jgi:hypothetical protein
MAFLIMLPTLVRSMDGTIAFDSKIGFATIEIRNVVPELMLPPEFESKDLSIPKQLP